MADQLPGSDPRTNTAERRLFGNAVAMLVLLVVQNAAGTVINLYVTVTDTSSYGGVYPAMFASGAGIVHTLVGVVLGIGTLFGFVLSRRVGDRTTRWIAVLPPIFVGLAAYLGFHFVVSGGDNAYSLAMELSFLGATVSEVFLLLLTSPMGGARLHPSAAPAS